MRMLGMLLALSAVHTAATSPAVPADVPPLGVPAWLYPISPPQELTPRTFDDRVALHVPGAAASFTERQLNDMNFAPDWRPASHVQMPLVVARGRAPQVSACGFCHSPTGQGRPENASLAGLPRDYLLEQLAAFKSGERRSGWPGRYRPSDRMCATVVAMTDKEAIEAAQYFAEQSLHPRVRVRETWEIATTSVLGWVYRTSGQAREPLGERIIEIDPEPERHERRDDTLVYIAYVPVGSISRGRRIAGEGVGGAQNACITCHGRELSGMGNIPPLAGRSPTYIARQLFAFKVGTRVNASAAPMKTVAATLSTTDIIAVSAFAGSLAPR